MNDWSRVQYAISGVIQVFNGGFHILWLCKGEEIKSGIEYTVSEKEAMKLSGLNNTGMSRSAKKRMKGGKGSCKISSITVFSPRSLSLFPARAEV